jgi:glutaminyl-tRNA synthetase
MSKRYLRMLVEQNLVDGWDDPRMPTLCGLRRRGYTPSAIFDFVERAGISKSLSIVNIEMLEHCIREELNASAPRRIAILRPIKVVITNYPEDKVEYFNLPNHPQHPEMGTRPVPFSRELYIDASDFSDNPPPKFFRLKPDGEVRLMGSYIIKCGEIVKDEEGNVVEIRCTADLETGNGNPVDGRKIKGTIHWLSAPHAVDTTVKLFDHLFTIEDVLAMPEGKTFDDYLNVNSCETLTGCKLEPVMADVAPGERFQFVRTGYFISDTKYPNTYNCIVGLKDSFKA